MSENENTERSHILNGLKEHDRAHLERLCADLMLNYVVLKKRPLIEQAAMLPMPTELKDLQFHELITWLQEHLDLPELNAFTANEGQVSVHAGGKSSIIAALAPSDMPTPAPVTPQAPQSTSPAASTSSPTPTPTPAATPAPASRQQSPQPTSNQEPASDRFSMLEID